MKMIVIHHHPHPLLGLVMDEIHKLEIHQLEIQIQIQTHHWRDRINEIDEIDDEIYKHLVESEDGLDQDQDRYYMRKVSFIIRMN